MFFFTVWKWIFPKRSSLIFQLLLKLLFFWFLTLGSHWIKITLFFPFLAHCVSPYLVLDPPLLLYQIKRVGPFPLCNRDVKTILRRKMTIKNKVKATTSTSTYFLLHLSVTDTMGIFLFKNIGVLFIYIKDQNPILGQLYNYCSIIWYTIFFGRKMKK